ncbi:MAG: 4Fe-4S dicluster domain-containing protein [Planctomycetes bacterium]|nr:4Fe-4S dicluster domain-containing protein [Planctomycetota bacterium]
MPQYGFVIDQRKCIGCHACTVACKAENEVPVGNFRTWVKYVEKGTYPSVKRHFTVLRCNHCDEAPCVEICPVTALHKRPDAIVDLDRDVCIGCRACMQACPYDALYLNEDTGTAEKCHYCAHRTEQGLEPACVVVCPTHAIIAGDVSNPQTEIAHHIATQPVEQRRLEKGTKPRVWYTGALSEALQPGAVLEQSMYLWSDRAEPPRPIPPGFEPPPDLISALDVPHPPAWGWHVWLYLLTKNVAAGAMLVAPLLSQLGRAPAEDSLLRVLPEAVALVFLGITMLLLVLDLGRMDRFMNILTRPNWKSWLVKGTWVLMGFGLLTTASLLLRLFDFPNSADVVRWLNLPFALFASGYTAFLFAQCKGRDLWLERGLFWHLILQAVLCGAVVPLFLSHSEPGSVPAPVFFTLMAILNVIWLRFHNRMFHADVGARRAHALLRASGAPGFAVLLLYGAALCALLPGLVTSGALNPAWLSAGAAAFALGALLLYERAYIKVGQEIPNS